jgi:hypothetical protein
MSPQQQSLANPEPREKIALLAKPARHGKPVARETTAAPVNLVVTTTAAAVEIVAGIVVVVTGTVNPEKKAREFWLPICPRPSPGIR